MKKVLFVLLAVLLLMGCQSQKKEKIPKTPAQTEAVMDTTEKDTIKAFYERMRHWEILHGGMNRRESDK